MLRFERKEHVKHNLGFKWTLLWVYKTIKFRTIGAWEVGTWQVCKWVSDEN